MYDTYLLTYLPNRRVSRQNIAIPFGVGKLEWWGYPMVKIF